MSTPVVVLVAGVGRSGSTLLEMMLADHLGAVAVGETRYLWERGLLRGELCSCGAPVPSCAFWAAVLAEAYGDRIPEAAEVAALQSAVNRSRRLPAALLPRLRSETVGGQIDELSSVIRPLHAAIAKVAERDIVIDSSKHPAYANALLDVPDLSVIVVHLVRDSRGVVHSWQRHVRRPEVHWQDEYMDRLPPLPTAVTWDIHNLALEVVGHRSRWYTRVRYEDFIVDPVSVLRQVAACCRSAGATGAGSSVVHSVAGNPLRFSGQAPVIRADVAWRSEMPWTQRVAVTAATTPMLVRYWYPLLRSGGLRSGR